MSGKLRLNGATSGYSELQAPDVAGDQTFTLPATGGELVTKQGGGVVVGYQQGTWTITSNANIAIGAGTWTRIGNRVTAFVRIDFDGNSGTSSCSISGLPYASDTSQDKEIGRIVGYLGYTNNGSPLGFLGDNILGDSFRIRQLTGSGNSLNLGNVSGLFIRGAVEYITNDTTWTPINGATVS